MKNWFTLLFTLIALSVYAKNGDLKGQLIDEKNQPVMFATVALYDTTGKLVKVEASDESGNFSFVDLQNGIYTAKITSVGYNEYKIGTIELKGTNQDLGQLKMTSNSVELAGAVVTAKRNIVEVLPDRTVFNVQGTINAAGDNGLDLLRKAPGVTIDNNNNVIVSGKNGVLVYVDGKRVPLSGQELATYLQGLMSDQIDRIDIISNPGSKYEAQGNAGIIDIRLKKNQNLGGNGSISTTLDQGKKTRGSLSANGNYRTSKVNTFVNGGYNRQNNFMNMGFESFQNGFAFVENNANSNLGNNFNYRVGLDYFLNKKSTIGVLYSGNSNNSDGLNQTTNRINTGSEIAAPDSILISENHSDNKNNQNSYNINYQYRAGEKSLNIDADYGAYRSRPSSFQPNKYVNAAGNVLSSETFSSQTPSDIDIITFKSDYEQPGLKGKIGIGAKYSLITSDNLFLFNNVIENVPIQNNDRSNRFKYNENIYAGYINYSTHIGKKLGVNAGVRYEHTISEGNLITFKPELQEPPVGFNYGKLFPNLGLTYQLTQENSLNLSMGRRINRPDYRVLNPFKMQWSALSYQKGNPYLKPEIVNNIELGYTLKYKYNFKVSFSRTNDQITRLISPDEVDEKAGYISWDNLAHQDLWNVSASLPIEINKWWNLYTNLTAGYVDNQADYGNGAVVNVQAFTYNIFAQNTFSLAKGYKAEISGWYNGPGIWGGVFEYDPSYSLNVGIQKKFWEHLLVKLSAQDLTYQAYWSGISDFKGAQSTGSGKWDSRKVVLNLTYDFGNKNVKFRKRSTGLEEESKRIGQEN